MVNAAKAIRRAFFMANRLQAMIAGWVVLVIVLITCYGVFTRYVLHSPDIWSFPVAAYLLGFVVFLAVSHTLQRDIHVRVDFFLTLLPARAARWVRVLADLASLIFIGLFVWQAWKLFDQSYSAGRIDETTLGWSLAAVQWIFPVAGGFLLVTNVLLMLSRLLGEEPDEPEDDEIDGSVATAARPSP